MYSEKNIYKLYKSYNIQFKKLPDNYNPDSYGRNLLKQSTDNMEIVYVSDVECSEASNFQENLQNEKSNIG